jgi:adenosylcobyric acid synthase
MAGIGMAAKALMFQGTGSDVGKSTLVAGIARLLHNRGLRVRPFKPQNMSNNAAVTADGGEIGRAQALQARAAGVAPSVHMNPVLLKPQSEVGAQVVVQGRVVGNTEAAQYQDIKPALMATVLDSFARLCNEADIVLVEGAGSASEVNLRQGDIANMGFARAADVPVVLIGDIERGGVIASLVGTQAVLPPADANLIEGFIVNKFRGDPALFADGMRTIAEVTGWRGLGLVPYFDGVRHLPAEDMLGLGVREVKPDAKVRIAVLAYPRVSNFDDFDPLRLEPSVDLEFIRPATPIPASVDLVVLPGSKATIADLADLRAVGWDIDLKAHVRRGGRVLGICGGYQMLGNSIADPTGIEGPPGTCEGLGLLDVATRLTGNKLLVDVTGTRVGGAPFNGYEMHVGRTDGADCARPVLKFSDGRMDGAASADGRVEGCYVHGLFAGDAQRREWLERLGAGSSAVHYDDVVDATLNDLAQHLERHVDCDALLALARAPRCAA